MAISFHELSATNYLQALHAVAGFLDKSLDYLREAGIDPEDVVEARVHPDMWPFRLQVQSVVHHSHGAMKAVMDGRFAPPSGLPEHDYAGLQGHVDEAIRALGAYAPEEVNAREEADIVFAVRGMEFPYVAKDFVMSFSLPNVHFHAATAYGILRAKGAPVGKRDFIGMPRMKT